MPFRLAAELVTESAAGTEMVTLPDFEVSAAEIAFIVMDWLELAAAGGVNVTAAPEALEFADSVPPDAVQDTPALLGSLVTVAVTVTELVPVPSTLVADAWTLTPMVAEPPPELPPQPVVKSWRIASVVTPRRGRTFRTIERTSIELLY